MGGSVEPLETAVQIPHHFRCPISLELMRDPVIIATGQTYDRSSIESWVATGNTTCPVTRLPLTDFTLIPNHNLRRLIQEWCVANRRHGVERIPTPKQPADPAHVRSLLDRLSAPTTAAGCRLSAVRQLRSLARDSEKNRCLMSTLAAQDPLVSVILAENPPEVVEEALVLLAMFAITETPSAALAARPDRLTTIVSLLDHPSVGANIAGLIEGILCGSRPPDLRVMVGEIDGIFAALVRILKNPSGSPKAVKAGLKALFSLCLARPNRLKAISAGAADAILRRLADSEKIDVERAVAVLELLCREPCGCAAFGGDPLTVPLLVKIVMKTPDRITEHAIGALLSLCSTSEAHQRAAVSAGIVTHLLLLLQSDCTERAKRKAQLLLKLFRESWPQQFVANSFDFGCG